MICTAQYIHIGTRQYQQDALFVSDSTDTDRGTRQRAFAVLCDGMGGTEYGGQASSLAVYEMAVALDALERDDDVVAWLHALVCELDGFIYARLGPEQAGTTVVAAHLEENRLHWVSVGDSRIYLIRGDDMICLTRDHNLQLALDHEVGLGNIETADVEAVERRDALISFLGQGTLPLIDRNTDVLELASGDVVLLCSDGLTKSLEDDRIAALVREEEGDLDRAARRLVLEAFDTGGDKDNTSVALMRYLDDCDDVITEQETDRSPYHPKHGRETSDDTKHYPPSSEGDEVDREKRLRRKRKENR